MSGVNSIDKIWWGRLIVKMLCQHLSCVSQFICYFWLRLVSQWPLSKPSGWQGFGTIGKISSESTKTCLSLSMATAHIDIPELSCGIAQRVQAPLPVSHSVSKAPQVFWPMGHILQAIVLTMKRLFLLWAINWNIYIHFPLDLQPLLQLFWKYLENHRY